MIPFGKKLAAGGSFVQAISSLVQGLMYLLGNTFLVALAGPAIIISGLSYIASALGFLLMFPSERRVTDLCIGGMMAMSIICVFLIPAPEALQSVLSAACYLVMILASMKRQDRTNLIMVAIALIAEVPGGYLITKMGDWGAAVALQGVLSGVISGYCCFAVARYAWTEK